MSGLPSTSLPESVTASVLPSSTDSFCAAATGASFTGFTVIATVTVAESAAPSFTLKVKPSVPL